MKVLQSVLALLLVLVLGCATTSTVSAATIEEGASGDLIATLEKARDVREQADIKIRENLKLMASSCLYMSDSLKELMALENQFEHHRSDTDPRPLRHRDRGSAADSGLALLIGLPQLLTKDDRIITVGSAVKRFDLA